MVRPKTNIKELIGKQLTMEVAADVNLNIEVLNDKEIKYQFIGSDGTKDEPVITNLAVKYDNIDSVFDYSFTDGIATRFFLFQFSCM